MGEKGGFFTDNKKISERIYQVEKRFGLVTNPDKKVYNMSVGEKQTVEILKVLYRVITSYSIHYTKLYEGS